MSQKTNPNLGKTAIDKITGFKGIITGFAQYITGCDQYLLVPKAGDQSKYPEGNWMDVNRLTFQEEEAIQIDTSEYKGACESAPLY